MPAREPPGVEIKGSDECGDESFELESNLLEISPLQLSLSRIRRALDDAARYRRRTPSLMRSILSIAAYSVLSKTTTPTGECAKNDRRFRARCSRIPSVSKARRRRQDGIRMERESSDIKSSRRRRTKVEALNSIQIASFLLFIGAKMQRRREAMRTEDLLAALNLQERR